MTIDINEMRKDKRPQSSTVVHALLDRLEAAEKERDALRAAVRHEADCVEAAKAEIDALRAKIEHMEQKEPVFWWRPCSDGTYEGPLHNNSIERVRKQSGAWSPLYALPGAQEQEPTRDWWDCLIADISAIDCMYRGSPTYAHDAYWMRDHVVWMLKKRRDALLGAQGND